MVVHPFTNSPDRAPAKPTTRSASASKEEKIAGVPSKPPPAHLPIVMAASKGSVEALEFFPDVPVFSRPADLDKEAVVVPGDTRVLVTERASPTPVRTLYHPIPAIQRLGLPLTLLSPATAEMPVRPPPPPVKPANANVYAGILRKDVAAVTLEKEDDKKPAAANPTGGSIVAQNQLGSLMKRSLPTAQGTSKKAKVTPVPKQAAPAPTAAIPGSQYVTREDRRRRVNVLTAWERLYMITKEQRQELAYLKSLLANDPQEPAASAPTAVVAPVLQQQSATLGPAAVVPQPPEAPAPVRQDAVAPAPTEAKAPAQVGQAGAIVFQTIAPAPPAPAPVRQETASAADPYHTALQKVSTLGSHPAFTKMSFVQGLEFCRDIKDSMLALTDVPLPPPAFHTNAVNLDSRPTSRVDTQVRNVLFAAAVHTAVGYPKGRRSVNGMTVNEILADPELSVSQVTYLREVMAYYRASVPVGLLPVDDIMRDNKVSSFTKAAKEGSRGGTPRNPMWSFQYLRSFQFEADIVAANNGNKHALSGKCYDWAVVMDRIVKKTQKGCLNGFTANQQLLTGDEFKIFECNNGRRLYDLV